MQATATHSAGEQSISGLSLESAARQMEDVVSERMPALYRNAYRFVNNAADAEDVVQDALLSAYKHLDQFRGESQMSTWLTAIVSNSARMQLRRRPRQIHVSLDEKIGEEAEFTVSDGLADSRPNPEDECRSAELDTRVRHWLGQLSPVLRMTYQLRDLEGLSTREVADMLSVPHGTVKARLARARAKLKRLMRRPIAARPALAMAASSEQ